MVLTLTQLLLQAILVLRSLSVNQVTSRVKFGINNMRDWALTFHHAMLQANEVSIVSGTGLAPLMELLLAPQVASER